VRVRWLTCSVCPESGRQGYTGPAVIRVPSRVRPLALAGACVCALALAAVRAQQPPPPTFRTGVDAVVLDVSVLDKDRLPVRGLTAADFTVFEDGKPQAVRTFKAIDLEDVVDTTLAPWTRQVAPDVRRNDDVKDKRVVVIVMDSSTPMLAAEVPLAKRLGRAVVEALSPDDLAAVVYTYGKTYGQNFTQDKAKLLAAVERFNGGIDKAALGEYRRAFNEYDASAPSLYLAAVSTLRGVAEEMAALPERRKALVFVSVGVPLDLSKLTELARGGIDDVGTTARLIGEMKETFAAAQRANVSIYGADPGGLRGDAASLNQDFLKTMSANTGGFVITDTNDPTPGVTQVYRENGSYYLLGYQPANARVDGRFRTVEVKVNRPGVAVRARNGYFEPNAKAAAREAAKAATSVKAPAPAVSAIGGILPKVDLQLRMHAVPFAKEGSRDADVAIILQGQHARPEGSTATADDVDVVVHAYDLDAKLQASDNATAHLGLRKDTSNELRYGVLSRLTLKPGRYQLRLAAHSALAGRSGSVYAELDVPDFSKPALSLSGVMLEATPSPVAAPKGKLASLIPIVPTAERTFAADETVTAFARIYEGGKDPHQPVDITTRILDGAGAEVFSKVESVGADRFGASRSADVTLALPLSTLPPGPYLLSVVATRGKVSARQDVRFSMRKP
jgi:VWFA-related protein